CDECVAACVTPPDDGRSRLFLDGPRFGKFLVPTTCRSCLDPVCMIGCPVGSIHRGGNGEILIRDWCIGCKKCAEQCPYGAIQMHDNGLIPEVSHAWRHLPEAAAPASGWLDEDARDRAWRLGSTPFHNDREFRSGLEGLSPDGRGGEAILFRHEFQVRPDQLGPDRRVGLAVTSACDPVAVWINGEAIIGGPDSQTAQDRPEVSSRERRGLGRESETELESRHLRPGRNTVAVRVGSLPEPGALVLGLRLAEVRQA